MYLLCFVEHGMLNFTHPLYSENIMIISLTKRTNGDRCGAFVYHIDTKQIIEPSNYTHVLNMHLCTLT